MAVIGKPKSKQEDDEPLDQKMESLTSTLNEQFKPSAILESTIRENLKGLGYEI